MAETGEMPIQVNRNHIGQHGFGPFNQSEYAKFLQDEVTSTVARPGML